jgi:cell division protein FtsB
MASSSSARSLFGGAISMLLPSHLIDASEIRQVPDTQEVFLYPESGISVILEILEQVAPSDLEDAAKFHFDSLAHDNSAASATVTSVEKQSKKRDDETPAPTLLIGVQKVAKYNRDQLDTVQILLALFRVQSKNIDLVLSFNVPTVTQDTNAVGEVDMLVAREHFRAAAESLQILDFGLFA